jgi:hypothetical protein
MKKLRIRPALLVAPLLTLIAASSVLLAQTTIDQQLKLEPGGRFVLESAAGSIELTGTSASGAHVLITSKSDDLKDKFDFKFEETPGVVRVIVKKKGSWASGWFSGSSSGPNFKIEVPKQTALELKTGGGSVEVSTITGDANIETSGGHIAVTDLKGKLTAETSGGHFRLRDIDGDAKIETSGGHIDVKSLKGSLHAETSGGHIEISDVTGDIDTSTSGGHISISGAGGRVAAETSGGSVQVAFTKGNAHGGRIKSSGGGITVSVDPGANLSVDAETSSGSVASDITMAESGEHSRSSLRGMMGKGGETLHLHTSAGSIRIQPI